MRTCVDRLAGKGKHTIANELASAEVKGLHTIAWQDSQGQANEATLEIKYHSLQVLPPIGKQKKYPALQLIVIHAQELSPPSHREPISWKLMTNVPINSLQAAIEKLDWYAMRWKIESAPQAHRVVREGFIMKCSKAVGKMMAGPSKSAVRSRFQTTPSGCY